MDLHTTPWQWWADSDASLILEKISEICESGVMRSDYRKRIGLNEEGMLTIDGELVPHKLIAHFIKSAYSIKIHNAEITDKFPFNGTKYEILIDGKTLSLIDHSDGFEEIYLDKKLHCTNGPARYNRKQGLAEYYVDGILHREEGPAIEAENKRVFALEGNRLSLLEFIMQNPATAVTHGYRGHGEYTVYRWQDYAVVRGLDGTEALLRKTTDNPEPDNFLIHLVSERLDDYQVLYYNETGYLVEPIFNMMRSLGSWDYNTWQTFSEIKNQEDDSCTTLYYDIVDNELSFSSSLFTEDVNIKLDVGFERPFDDRAFPNMFVKRDLNGRKHCAEGPAVLTPSGKKEYHLHGVRVTRASFERVKFEPETGAYYWTDEQGQLHNSAWLPARIFPNGELHYYHHGLRHSDIFPAIEVPGPNFEMGTYFLYGNEVTPEEFNNYRAALKEIAFLENEKRHRLNGPARITFREDGTYVKEHYVHGVLHNSEGPARVSSDGGFEYIKDGVKHREDGPAYWSPKDNRLEFYVNGVKHNDRGPAVIADTENGRTFEFWKSGKKIGVTFSETSNGSLDILAKQGLKTMAIPKLKLKTDKLGNPSVKEVSNEKGAKMSVKFVRPGAAPSDSNDSRKDQILSGTKLGLKKGAIRVTSDKAATALAGYLPMQDNAAMQRLVQLMLLLGSAELIERMPASVGEKIGLDQARRDSFGGLTRYVSGEILGKDAVQIVTTLAPTLLDALRQLSASDIAEAANSMVVEEVQHEVVTG